MGILSTVGQAGEPWGAAVYFVADENFRFYFVTRTGTRKYHDIEESGQAALTIADADTQTTVQVHGAITKVPLEDYTNIVFDKLAGIKPKEDHAWAPPISKVHEGNYMALCLTPDLLQYADYKQQQKDYDADYIEKIIG